MQQRRVHYVLSAHWDREWYLSFQDFRFRLVKLFDGLLEGWKSGKLKGPFQTDGQAIILEDYLEIRPEKRDEIKQLAKEGKLVIGPWYVLPDEFIVSGESLIRNLLLGRQMARAYGTEPSDAGFICDLFGHNSQMPQIFAGFGIKSAFLFRGTNEIDKRLFKWRGADGTEVVLYRFGGWGYCDYAMTVRPALPFPKYNTQTISDKFDTFLDSEAAKTEVDALLLFDGCDHNEWDPPTYAVLFEKMAETNSPYKIMHTSLDQYLDDVLPQMDHLSVTVEGELREAGLHPGEMDTQWLIPGVLSSRIWIKQTNAACQTLLCQWAEPVSSMAYSFLGKEYPKGFLDVAWKWLITNHPHDSICGCSIDAVHEDMKYRFAQCYQIAERITAEESAQIAASIEGNLSSNELRVTVFNPLPVPFDDSAELKLYIPANWSTFNEFFGYEPKPAFRIYNASGEEVPYQRLSQEGNRTHIRCYAYAYKTVDTCVSVHLKIPALGYTNLTIREGEAGHPTRYSEVPGLATSERSMANEKLEVTIESNGSLTIKDRRNGQVYERWLTFEDQADIGDGWFHGIPVNNQTFVSTASNASVALVHNGLNLTTFRIRTVFNMPAEFEYPEMVRSNRMADLVVDSTISLRPGSDHIEVETKVHNTVLDHRLRVLFPTNAQIDHFYSDTPFDVVKRPVALPVDNHLYRELNVETQPQQSWTAVYDGKRGLAVVSTGLLEATVQDLPERIMALTLFRSTRHTVNTDGEPLGQLQDELNFKYWLVPLCAEPDQPQLCRLGQLISAGLRTVQLNGDEINLHKGDIKLPSSAGFLQVSGPVVVTSVRQTETGLEVRLFNPGSETARAVLDISARPDSVHAPHTITRVDFEHHPLNKLANFKDNQAGFTVKAKEIITVIIN